MPKVDAVVIGAGAGGGVVAKELAVNGLSVVVLERGAWVGPADDRKDDLRNQRTSILGNNSGPDEEGNPRVIVDLQGRERVVKPSQGGYSNNAACVGGGTLTYGAMAWRFHPNDFRMKSVYGAPQGSTLEDWPIGYDDLEPFYEKAEWEIGVSGDDSNNTFKGPRASRCLCRRSRRRPSTASSTRPRGVSAGTRSTSRCCGIPYRTTAAERACGAGGASDSPARWTPSAARRIR